MKVPLSLLKKYLDLDLSPNEIADTLSMGGIEVDQITTTPLAFEGVVVAKILSVEPHPQADMLKIAAVFDGSEQLQIVCGAPNCRPGMRTALAKIGAQLKDADGKTHKIKKGKLRGVESFGMLCSADELRLSADAQGILELPDNLAEGTDLSRLYSDTIFEISLTPNLGHCMSVIGIARELAALLNLKMKLPSIELHEDKTSSIHQMLHVEIRDQENCHRYACRIVKNIQVGPSPEWLVRALEASGIRSINNIVDIGNYIMLETGQPLHIFDYEKIEGQKIIIESNTPHKELLTLDEKCRTIPDHSLLICDQNKALAFAGVMGGYQSAIEENTKTVLIEAAFFSPQAIRRSSKLLNLRSESSQRFEKGIDPLGLIRALEQAACLIQQIAGGNIVSGMIDCGMRQFTAKHIRLRIARTNQILGTELSLHEISSLLQRLELKISASTPQYLDTIIPSYRNDLNEEIDLIEEVGRVYGFNHIPQKLPLHISSPLPDDPIFEIEHTVRDFLLSEGLQEFLTCDLISPGMAELALEKGENEHRLISVLHPSSIDQSVLRSTLFPGLLQAIKYNIDHQNADISAFEIGKIHFKDQEHFKEQSMAGIILTGKKSPYHFNPKPQEVDFFDLKGILENLFEFFKIASIVFEPSHFHAFHPHKQARIKSGQVCIGVLGEMHPASIEKLGIEQPVFFAEINLHDLLLLKTDGPHVVEPSPFPGSQRDWTLSLKSDSSVQLVLDAVKTLRLPLLENVILLDLYTSEKIGMDRKRATFRFFYRDKHKTLSLEQVEKEHLKLVSKVTEKLQDHL